MDGHGQTGKIYNIEEWIEANKDKFMPPVSLRMMHDKGQMQCFFVGGPNQRKDYHLECGEELFYMRRGDMVLKVVERGAHKDVVIKQGQMFLLPARIPHSPQRSANTIGLVQERARALHEKDGLRYFIEESGVATTDILYEEWFHCNDLSSLGAIIKRFFDSEAHKTGKPIPGSILDVKPLEVDTEKVLPVPFDFHKWVEEHEAEINEHGFINVFPNAGQFSVFVVGQGERQDQCEHAEAWVWQLDGESELSYGDTHETLKKDDSLLVPANDKFTIKQKRGSIAFVSYQDPSKCSTWRK